MPDVMCANTGEQGGCKGEKRSGSGRDCDVWSRGRPRAADQREAAGVEHPGHRAYLEGKAHFETGLPSLRAPILRSGHAILGHLL